MKEFEMKAFPSTKPLDSWDDPNQGMDLRDYFAIKFAQTQLNLIQDEGFDALETFKISYKLADVMMEARKK
jgi:hypothetical protein